ncbi:MAG: hypothetical protein AAFW73_13910 [Bacteroidota bacterium]
MNRKLTLTFWVGTLCMVLFPLAVFTQSNVPPCNGADPTGTSCDATCIPCVDGINGYTNTVPPVNNPTAPNPLCNGNNVPNNTQWLAFVAGTTNLTLSIAWGNCTQGNGMQAGIVGGCPDINTTGVVCSGACPGPNPIVLSASGLIPGDDYFIWFDGCAGASCEYTVTVVSGSTIFDQPPGPTVAPFGPLTGCPGGAPVNYQTFPVANATDYIWTVNPGADIVVNGTNATISWPPGVEGTYEVCVQAVNACFQADVECFFVDVAEPTETFLGPNFYCPEDPGYFYPGTNLFYGVGQNEIVFTTAAGCDSTVFLEVEEYFVEPGFIDTAICFGDFALIDGVPYTIPLINTEIPLNNFTTVNGCDSSVVVNLEVVRPIIDGFTVDAQLNCANFDIGTVIFVDSPQFGDPNASWEWSTDDGQVCDGNVNSEILFVCAPGTYVVTLTYTDFNQFASCTMVDSIEIIADFTPPTLAGSSTPANCGDPVGTATVDVTNTTNPEIEWDSNAGGQMTATATDLAPGSYWVTVTGENGCVDSLEVNVVGTPPIDIVEEAIQPANCNGEANGSATISLVDAVGTTTILWTPTGQNGLTATGLAAGTYTVFVTDANGCTAEEMVTITEPTVVEMLSVTPDTQLDCNGDTDATATAAGQGGTGMLNYQWGPGTGNQTGPTATGLGAGTYSVTVTDENGCLDIGSVTITEPTLVEMTSVTAGLLDCNGDLDGTATATGQGGTGMLNYQWGPGTGNQTGPIATGLGAGTYNVTVTDQNGCSDIGSVTITEPTLVEMTSVTASQLDCNGDQDATASASGQGGTGNLTYQWGPAAGGQVGPTAVGLGAGTYYVTVTDVNGCSDVGEVTITEPTLVEMTSVTADLLDCNGDLDGTATASGQGGTGTLNFQWGPGTGNQTGPMATGLGAGTYYVTVTDMNGCSDVGEVTITDPVLVEMTGVTASLLDCNGDLDGTATATGQGGTGTLDYQWGPGTGNQTGPMATGLGAGTYNVTVTDVNGCSDIGSVTITEPVLLEMISVTATLLDCGGDTDATATANGQGGTGALNYQWGPGTGNQTGPTATGLGAGTYNVSVIDDNGCVDIGSVTITEPTPVQVSPLDQVNVACYGESTGSATVEASGGTAPYDYLWDANAGSQPTATANSLTAGIYNVTATDANGCAQDYTVTITEPAAPLAALTDLVVNATCGESNGSIGISVSGGTGTIYYQWDVNANSQTGPVASSLGAGTYSVTITDDNNCELIYSETVSTPNNFEANVLQVDSVSCFGDSDGNIMINVTGGNDPYTYQWNYVPTPNAEDLMGVPAGPYSLTITDADGCEITLTTNVGQPEPLQGDAITTLASCGLSDGSINLTVTGGTTPYTYAWTGGAMPVQDPTGLPAGNYEVTITDAKLCETIVQTTILVPNGPMLDFTQEDAKCYLSNTGSIEVNITGGTPPFLYDWSNGLPAPPISNPGSLPAGNYEVVVTDINNCSITQSFVITEPAELTADILNIVPATCGDANGSVEIDVNGGTPPYTFLWNGSIMDQNPSGLPAGDYNLVATDANGCTVSALAQVIPPDGLAFQPTDVRPVSCFGDSDGEIQLNVTGGMPPFDYVWDPPQGNIANPSGLTAGIYLATVTDANGCPLETSVTIPEPAALFAQSFPLNASCANNDGSITLQVQGGTMGYSFSWEGPGGFTSSSRDLSGLAMGDYYLTITDANSCPYQLIETISIPDAPTAISSIVDVDCFGNSTGRIAVVAAGGAGSYTYNWSGGIAGNEPIATGVTQGVYSVTITDAQSCSFVLDDLTVNEPPVLDLTGSTTQATCNQSNGSVTAVVDGGTMPYRYDWSPTLPNSPNQPGLGVGTYTLTVTDANDCTIVESFVVGSPENLGASTTHIDVTCNGGSDGSISLTASGGTPPFTFQWDNGAGAVQNPGGLTANTYNVVVTDANGCTIVASATITEPPLIEVSTVGTIDATCGLANGSIDVDVIGGTGGYQYVWTNSSGTTVSNSEDPTGLSAGTYLATVTDASGCTMTFTESVTTPNMLLVSTTADPTSCFGGDDGIVQVMVTGGIPPFDYTWQDPQYMGDRLEGVPAGTYFVTVTDADDCTFTEQAVVEEPPQLLAVSEVPLGISCNGESDAAAIIAATGGTPPYQYDWREDALDGQQAPENLASGEYQVTVIDSKGCQFTETFNISDPPELVSSITGAPANCFGAADGGIEVLASGGTGDYVYVWTSDLDSIANPTGVAAGTYSVSVYDANNCLTTESFEVTQPTEVLLEVESVSDYAGFNVSCAESTDGSVTVTATGGTGPYDFTWEDGREGATVGDLSPGVFLVTVTDANDCPFEDQVSLTSPEPVVTEPDFIPIQCHGDANGMIFVDQVGGGAAPYRYSIDGSVFGSGVFPGLTAGEYIVETMDANGCMDRDTIMITEPDPINIDLGGDQEIAWGDSTTIEPEITGIPLTAVDTFFWLSPGEFECWSDDCLDLLVRPLISTPYTIRIRDENNCVTEDQVMVRVKKERLVYIPTGFAPDATDPNNQSFTIFAGQGVEEIESLFIFDRWGEILYENTNFAPNNPDLGWDGTLQGEDMQPAVFVYIAKIRFSDGSVELFTGDVTLMR